MNFLDMKAKIIAAGIYMPKTRVSNDDLAKSIDTSDTWISERTGIHFRHIAAENEYTSDLAATALSNTLKNANLRPNDLDGLIIATTTPDLVFPSTASIVQRKTGITNNSFAFDVAAVCSGFIYAITIANSMIVSGSAKRIGVVGAETMSRIVDWNDRSTCVLFGDGAGAVIVGESDGKSGIIDTSINSNGAFEEILKVPGGISFGNKDASILMNGKEVYKHAVEKFTNLSIEQLSKNDFDVADLDWYIPHQANKRIMDTVAARIGLPLEKCVVTIDKYANTSAATIPITLYEALIDGRIQHGHLIQMPALGAGLTWGSALLRW